MTAQRIFMASFEQNAVVARCGWSCGTGFRRFGLSDRCDVAKSRAETI